MDVFPMTRDCATQLGTGMTSGSYQFVDGTGTWCGSSNGGAKLQLQVDELSEDIAARTDELDVLNQQCRERQWW